MVYLVGAGPGDPGLLTRRGAEVLGRAEVLVYDGLVHTALLELVPSTCTRVYAGKKHARGRPPLTQDEINAELIAHARAGKRVVRLKGGDPFVFGRGAEECRALREAGLAFEIVPGVTAATAVPAYAGIPLTARDRTSSVAFATGHEQPGKGDSAIDWQALAKVGTLVLFMAVRTAAECAQALIAAGRDPQTPAAAVYWGTTARQRTVVAPLVELAQAMDRAALKPPALLVVGEVVALRPQLDWFEQRPLFGLRVLVPRAEHQAASFAARLRELGAEPVLMPVTRVAAPAEPDPAWAQVLESSYTWTIFTSANAVEQFFAALRARGRDARFLGGARLACVGRATEAALAAQGLICDLLPERGDAAGVAAAVLAASEAAGESVAAQRVLLPRAAEGREEAIAALRAAGCAVQPLTVYRSETTPSDHPSVEDGVHALRTGAIDAVAFFAPSQVQALLDIAEAAGLTQAEVVERCAIVAAIGATTQAALEQRGIAVHAAPERPEAALLVEALIAARARPRD